MGIIRGVKNSSILNSLLSAFIPVRLDIFFCGQTSRERSPASSRTHEAWRVNAIADIEALEKMIERRHKARLALCRGAALAARSSGRSTEISSQTKITTVMSKCERLAAQTKGFLVLYVK
jgi:hypothetical protein